MKRELEQIIRGLLEFEGRPTGIGSTELLLVIWLVTRGAIEKPVRASWPTLGMALGASDVTVWRAIKKLAADGGAGWVEVKSGKGRGNASLYNVLLDRLPVAAEIKLTVVSKQATEIAAQYCKGAKVNPFTFKKRRFTQGNKQRIAFCIQTFLEKHCHGDVQLLIGALNHARTSAKHRKKYFRGLHELRRDFSAIVQECRGTHTPAAAPAPTPARVTAEQSAQLEEAARKQATKEKVA
jgi:hypothetical protein